MVRVLLLGGVERVGGCTGEISEAKSNRTLNMSPLSTNGEGAFTWRNGMMCIQSASDIHGMCI